ncbi:MAG: hypothetical protein CL917_10945 [Deltaproteobacteria bacterium]|nr:hypothetical protein [Deltaproteobacteria bacterium]
MGHGMTRILYLGDIIPTRSETFVYREIFALRKRGVLIDTASLHAPEYGLGDTELDDLAASSLPIYPRGFLRIVLDAVSEVIQRPLQSFKTLAQVFSDSLFGGDLNLERRLKLLWQGVASLSLASRVRVLEVKHIHAHFAHVPTTLAMYTAMQLNVGFSFTGHAVDIFPNRTLLTEKVQRAKFVACISEWHRDFYRSLFQREDEDLVIVRCGVDSSLYEITPAPFGEVFELLAVGRLVEKKGFDTLLRALIWIGKENLSPIHLTLVGDGPLRNELENMASQLPAHISVTLTGDTPNQVIMEKMATADLFVLPCSVTSSGDRDGIPVVLMEAMVHGRCVIAGDLEAIRELVRDDVSGVIVPLGDPVILGQEIESLRSDRLRMERLGRGARARVEEEFDIHLNAQRLAQRFTREG